MALAETQKMLTIRVPESLKEHIRTLATDAGMTMNGFIVMSLRSAVRKWDSGFINKRRYGKRITQPEKPYWPSGWPRALPCLCGEEGHDPKECSAYDGLEYLWDEHLAEALKEVR